MSISISREVVEAVGNALTPENLREWWEYPHGFLGGLSPEQVYEAGGLEEVLKFIESAKSGDMA